MPARCSFSICARASRAMSPERIRPVSSACRKWVSLGRKLRPSGPKTRNRGRRRDRLAVGENDVAADPKDRMGASDLDGVVEGLTACHERCGGEDTRGAEFGDGAVDAAREAKIVRVEDEASRHSMQFLGRATGRCPGVPLPPYFSPKVSRIKDL